jgi:hypothetical protein
LFHALRLYKPLKCKGGVRNKHILVISDYYTKWTECFAMPNMEAKTVAKLLVVQVIVRFGTPYVIHTDQGVQFESNLIHAQRF